MGHGPGLVEHAPKHGAWSRSISGGGGSRVGAAVNPVPAGLPAGAGIAGRALGYWNLLGRLLGVRAFWQGNDQYAFDLPGADAGLVDLPV